MHDGQLTVPVGTVRALVAAQFPAWRNLDVRAVDATGTVNAIFRIGDGLAARFPLVAADYAPVRAELEAEAAAGFELAGRTRFATPEPVALGEPGPGYPLPWSVQTWLPGVTAVTADPGDSDPFARDLADFITAVRAIGTGGRGFRGSGRGGVLRDEEEWIQTCLAHSAGLLEIVPRLRALWSRMRELPRGPEPDVMNHSDLIPGNVLVSGPGPGARLTGILDVGGLGPADPGPGPGGGLAPAGRRAAADLPRRAGQRRPGIGPRPGLGVRAGHRPGLVLPQHQPGHRRGSAGGRWTGSWR